MDVDIRIATMADLGGMREVLTAAELSTLEVLDPGSHFWVACRGSTVIGTCGLEVDGTNGLLRSIAVASGERASGIGRSLVNNCIAFARSKGIEQLYLFSKDTGSYFLALGWAEVAVESAAAALQKAAQVQRYERVGWYANERAFLLPL